MAESEKFPVFKLGVLCPLWILCPSWWTLYAMNRSDAGQDIVMRHENIRGPGVDIERYAIRCALGNNGGGWASHYDEGQKEFWRQFVRDLVRDIRAAGVDIASVQANPAPVSAALRPVAKPGMMDGMKDQKGRREPETGPGVRTADSPATLKE
jgi:hypothetical protein